MIYSMTGFGRGEAESDKAKFIVEIKTVNHRFLDTSFKLPQYAYSLEERMLHVLKEKIGRGKVDINLTIKSKRKSQKTYVYDNEAAEYFVKAKNCACEEFSLNDNFGVAELFRMPGVIVEENEDYNPDELWEFVSLALDSAINQLLESRSNEGMRLRDDLILKTDRLNELASLLEERAPKIVDEYRSRLREKVSELIDEENIDENRLCEEVVVYSDKICIDEEIVRLRSHASEMRDTLDCDEPIGRKMDFISQELNRESNTILSKSTDTYTADIGIELKTLIEKIREQVQNLE
ncbi:MAG: YicC family protein [Lachnospiraceae bacterium]|nr:YicC family protein [Lachnospiraceae bacterium]